MIIPEKAVLRASQWCYKGIWSFFTQYLNVPEHPPELKGADDQHTRSFRPSNGFLRYLKFFFWIGLFSFDVGLFVLWIVLLVATPPFVSIPLTPIIWAIMVLPDIVAYIAIHLRYDTTWYVLSDRSMRIRRGIYVIHETTITYENIQNVSVSQGPLQRYFGFSNVVVETAGGGAAGAEGSTNAGHHGLLEGIDNAEEIRALILAKWQQSKSAGLGDEIDAPPANTLVHSVARGSVAFSDPEQLQLLESIRDLAVQLSS